MKTLPSSFGKLFCLSLLLPSTLVVTAANTKLPGGHTPGITHTAARLSTAKSGAGAITTTRSATAIRSALRTHSASNVSYHQTELKIIKAEALSMFEDMNLKDSGLNEQALEYGLIGYHRLLKKKILHKIDVLSICDFSQPSSAKRLYIIDVRNRRLIYRTYVAHGMSSGADYANSFSNTPDSYKSSLGFYVTRNTYYGENGLSLRIDGMDRGFNTMARERSIVIHGASYVSERILHKYGVMGTTFGCPAIPEEMTTQIIPVLKNGSCFFIFYPSDRYLSQSTVLNG